MVWQYAFKRLRSRNACGNFQRGLAQKYIAKPSFYTVINSVSLSEAILLICPL